MQATDHTSKGSPSGQMKKYIAYARRSTAKQDNSLSIQFPRIESHPVCRQMVQVSRECDTVTGTKVIGRNALESILKKCRRQPGYIDYILIQKWDRLGRNLEETMRIIRLFSEAGVEANAVEQWIDYNCGATYTMLGFYLGQAQDESNKISDRTKDSMRYLKEKGYYISPLPPRGYQKEVEADTGRKILVPSKDFEVVQKILMSLGDYSKSYLYSEYKYRVRLSHTAFMRLFSNPVYTTHVQLQPYKSSEAKLVKWRHEAMIDLDTFYRNQKINSERDRRNRRKKLLTSRKNEYVLKGHLTDSKGNRMTASASKSRSGKRHHYYHTSKQTARIRVDTAHELVYNALASLIIPSEVRKEIEKAIEKIASNNQKINRDKLKDLTARLSKIESRLYELKDAAAMGTLDLKEYRELKAHLSEQRANLEQQVKSARNVENPSAIAKRLIKSLPLIAECFKVGTFQQKDQLLRCLFPLGFYLDIEQGVVRTTYFNNLISQLFDFQGGNIKIISEPVETDSDMSSRVEDGTKVRTINEDRISIVNLLENLKNLKIS